MGVRRVVEAENPEISYVPASDSVLLGEILNGVTTLGGTVPLRKSQVNRELSRDEVPRPEHLKQSLLWSPGQAPESEVRSHAQEIYDFYSESSGDKGLICIGSNKSNSIVELVIANAFGAEPFVSQDDVPNVKQRRCPFFIRYREQDPQPASCMAGMKLDKSSKTLAPGIYYEDASGKWVQGGMEDSKHETALVFYIHRESLGRLEMVLAGFSGRATRLLARGLATRAQDFWPPNFAGQGMQIGAFIVQFSISTPAKKGSDILRTDLAAVSKVIAIPPESIGHRISQ
jgi:hypothetical protein